MDDDIRERLKEVGRNINAIGNQVSSTKSNVTSLKAMVDILKVSTETLETYIRIQLFRYENDITEEECREDYLGVIRGEEKGIQ